MKNRNAPVIQIGVSKDSIVAAREAVIAIIKSDDNEAVRVEGIRCLASLCSVNGTTISNSTISG